MIDRHRGPSLTDQAGGLAASRPARATCAGVSRMRFVHRFVISINLRPVGELDEAPSAAAASIT
jgi:hypothetical protein